jgi:hypothetical protein
LDPGSRCGNKGKEGLGGAIASRRSRRGKVEAKHRERHVCFGEHLFRSSVLGPRSSLGDDALGGSASFADFPSVDQGEW